MNRYSDQTAMVFTQCPSCGATHDATTSTMGSTRPKPGHFGICSTCGAGAVFDEELKLRKPNAKEQAFLDNNPEFRAIVKLIQGRKRS